MKVKRAKMGVFIIMIVAVLGFSLHAFALFDSDKAVHIDPKAIPPSTLIVGTHCIYISSLNDCLYEIAMESASQSSQSTIYYKSELADGAWFDITAAGSITDITTGSNGVPDGEIAALYMEYHTKEDGITYDLRTNKAVNIFNIVNPYDVEALPELLPIKNQHQAEQEGENNKDKIAFMEELLKKKVQNKETDKLDKYMEALDRYYRVLNEHGGTKNNKDTVLKVEESIDASRRVNVLFKLDKIIEGSVKSLASGKEQKVLDDDGRVFCELAGMKAEELNQSYEDSGSNVQNSIIKYMAKSLAEGTTMMAKLQFEFQMALIEDAAAKNDRQCDEDVANIQALDNISSGVVMDRDKELGLLTDRLIPMATAAFEADQSVGVNQEYSKATANQSSTVILDRIIEDYYNLLSAEVTELELYLDAKCQRISNGESQALIQEKLDKAYTYAQTVRTDAFQIKSLQAIQDYITWLENKKSELMAAAGGNELDVLQQKKDALTEEYLAALDKNDLLGAKSIMSAINDLANQMAELSMEASPNAKLVQGYTNEAMALISGGDTGAGDPGGLGGFGGIGGTGPNGNGGSSGSANKGANTGSDSKGNSGSGSGSGTVDGSGSGGGTSDGSGSGSGTIGGSGSGSGSAGGSGSSSGSAGGSGSSSGSAGGSGSSSGNAGGSGSGSGNEGLGSGNVGSGKKPASWGSPGGSGGNVGTATGNPNVDQVGMMLDSLNGLMESDYKTAFPAVQKIHDAMRAQKYSTASVDHSFDGMIAKSKDILAENQDLYEAGMVGIKDPSTINGIMDDFVEKLDGLNDGGKELVKITALNKVLVAVSGSHYETMISNKMNAIARKEMIKKNPYVFSRMKVMNGVYAPITAVAAKSGYRYVWYVSKSNAVLAKGAERYDFTAFSKRVEKNGVRSNMPLPAVVQGVLYLPSGYLSTEWNYLTVNLTGSDFGILLDSKIDKEAEKLMQLILN